MDDSGVRPDGCGGLEVAMHRISVNWQQFVVFVIISALFSFAVWKIDHDAIERVASVQKAGQANGRKIAKACRQDLINIDEAHTAIRAGFNLNARIAQDNINAIDLGVRTGKIPADLRSYYASVRKRQVQNRDHFRELAADVKPVQQLC